MRPQHNLRDPVFIEGQVFKTLHLVWRRSTTPILACVGARMFLRSALMVIEQRAELWQALDAAAERRLGISAVTAVEVQ